MVKDQGHGETAYGQLSTVIRHFLTYVRNAWTYCNETYRSYSLLRPRDTDDIFKVMGLKVKVTDNIF